MSLPDLIANNFSEEELRSLCFDLKVDYESLGGRGKTANARELCQLLMRRGRLPDLFTYVQELLPHLDLTLYARQVASEIPPQGVLPEPGDLPSSSRMAYGRNPFFIGRERELLTLADALLYRPTIQSVVITTTGPGGVGKTQLAAEFVYRYGRFFPGGVFWLSFVEPANIPAEIANCGGTHLHSRYDELKLDEQVRQVRQWWQESVQRLLIFDNCETEELLQKWQPNSGNCRVLVTSRRGRWSPVLGVRALHLHELSRPYGIELLRRFVPELQEGIANAISKELGDLPLALHLAGSFLARYGHSENYLNQLRDRKLLDHPSMQGHGAQPCSGYLTHPSGFTLVKPVIFPHFR